jgi:tetratricopeptide (TPR) repeat protein
MAALARRRNRRCAFLFSATGRDFGLRGLKPSTIWELIAMRYCAVLAIAVLAGVNGLSGSAWAAGEEYFSAACLKKPTAKCVTAAALSNLQVIDTGDKIVEMMMHSVEFDVVRALAASGALTEAYAYAESLDDAEKRDSAFVAIAQVEAKQNRLAQARELIAKVGAESRTGILGAIAEQQAAAGDIAGARSTVLELAAAYEQADSRVVRSMSLARVAELMQRVGEHRRAVEYLEQARLAADDPDPITLKNFNRIVIARMEVRILGVPAALKTARGISSAYERTLALTHVVTEAEEAGKHAEVEGVISEALQTAKDIDFALSRVAALDSIARLQAQLHDRAAADETFAMAMEVAESMGQSSKREQQEAFGSIASSQAGVGNAKEALETALRIRSDPIRVQTLLRIAIALGEGS